MRYKNTTINDRTLRHAVVTDTVDKKTHPIENNMTTFGVERIAGHFR